MDGQLIEMRGFLKSPSNTLICAASGAGKSTLCKQLVLHCNEIYDNEIKGIIYCYNIYQNIYDEMKEKGVIFNEGVPLESDILEWSRKFNKTDILIIFDDLAEQLLSKDHLATTNNWVSIISHHERVNFIFLTHNLFYKQMRFLSLNCHYFFLMNNSRDQSQILNFSRQTHPGRSDKFMDIYRDALEESAKFENVPPYLLCKTHAFDNKFQFLTNILPFQKPPILYIMT